MSTATANVKRGSKRPTLQDNLIALENSVKGNRASLDLSLSAAADPIVTLPDTLEILRVENRLDRDSPKVLALTSSINADLDVYSTEAKVIKDKMDAIMAKPSDTPKRIIKKYDELFFVGSDLLALNSRVVDTVTASSNQLSEILSPTPAAQSEVVS